MRVGIDDESHWEHVGVPREGTFGSGCGGSDGERTEASCDELAPWPTGTRMSGVSTWWGTEAGSPAWARAVHGLAAPFRFPAGPVLGRSAPAGVCGRTCAVPGLWSSLRSTGS